MNRRPALGYSLAIASAVMWSLNASIARELLDHGMPADRLAQLRSAGSWLLLLGALAVARPRLLRVRRADVPALAFLGIAGLAFVHALYFVAIERLPIGVALTVQYLAPLLLLLWLRVVHRRRLPASLWGAVGLAFAGCFLVVRAFDAGALDGLGLAAAFAAAISFAIYMAGGERAGHSYASVTTLVWAFGFATLFWALVAPWWTFPFDRLEGGGDAALAAGVVLIGTLLPFICAIAALRHIPAPRAGVVSTLEPVLAAVFAWLIHGEALAAIQMAGGAVVLAAVVWVQSNPLDPELEFAPVQQTR